MLSIFHLFFPGLVHGGMFFRVQPQAVREPGIREQPGVPYLWVQRRAVRGVPAGADGQALLPVPGRNAAGQYAGIRYGNADGEDIP